MEREKHDMNNRGDNSVGICVVQDEKIIEVNDSFLHILGKSKEIINTKLCDYIDPRDRYLFSSGLENLAEYRSESVDSTLIKMITKNGDIVSVNVRCIRNIYSGSNAYLLYVTAKGPPEPYGFDLDVKTKQLMTELSNIMSTCSQPERALEIINNIYDIIIKSEADRIKIEQSLMHEKRLSEAFTNSLPGVFYIYNRNGILQKWNKNLEYVTGYSSQEIAGIHFSKFLDGIDVSNVSNAVNDAFFKGETVVEANLISKERKRKPYYFTGTRITIDNVDYLLGFGIDIAEKKLLQAEAMRAAHLASLGELAAGVAHEINNPIHGIINCAQILIDQHEGTANDTQIPRMILKEGNRVADIVKNLLSFARYQKESHVPVSVEEVINDSVGLVKTQIGKEGIVLCIDLETNLPMIMGHPQEIQQVILNVISNARHALNSKSLGGSQFKRLEIKADSVLDKEKRKYVRITFLDNGIGIPAEIMDKICDPFFSTKPRGAGSGLGLSISFRIIKDHKGYLNFKSIEGEFTKVVIHIPADENG